MRISCTLPISAVLSAALLCGASDARLSIEQRLNWAKETIDAFAGSRHDTPPAKSTETRWKVSHIDGCTVELTQSIHREEPDSVLSNGDVLGLSEDRTLTWTFDLADLRPQFVIADPVGGPHISILAQGDAFHLKTDVVSRNVRRDGTIARTSTWSTPGTASNLWIYFDSRDGDNSQLIKRVESDLQSAVALCRAQARRR